MEQVRTNQNISSKYVPQGATSSNLGYRATGQAYQTQGTYVQPGSTSYEYSSVPQYAVQGEVRREGEVRRDVVQGSEYRREGEVRREGSRAVATDIPVESRIEYIPFEKKYIEYEQVEKVYQVPVEYEEVEYEEVVRNERVPYERTITDYYAVETQVEYIKREVEETVMVEEAVERTYQRVQYIPVETQVVHYPERENYVAQPTKTRTEYLGIVEGAYKGQQKVEGSTTYQTYSAPAETRVETRYVDNRADNRYVDSRADTRNQTRYVESRPVETRVESRVDNREYRNGSGVRNEATYAQNGASYQTGYVAPATTYQTGYVTGGSGVRQSGYVTGGSGIKASYQTGIARP